MSNVNLIAFGTFGNPNGFTQTFFAGNPIKDIKTFDIRGSILIYPQSKLYSIRKEYKNRQNIISYAVYTYAKEPTSAREGSFIGSSLLFIDKIAEENITIQNLNEFHQNLIAKNVQNDTITVNHSNNFDVKECKPIDFDKIGFNVKNIEDLNFIQSSNKNLAVLCRTNDNILQSFFQKSIDLLNIYDTIYFTDSKEVAEFVRQKGIFTAVDEKGFEQEIQKLHDERKRKIANSISDFEKEIQRLNDDKIKTLNEFKEQIEHNEKLHQENDRKIKESKNELEEVKKIYNDFSDKIRNLTNQLKSGKKLDDIKRLYNENKRIFINSVNQIKRPNFVNNIQKPKANTGLRTEQQPIQTGHFDQYNDERYHRRKSKGIDVFKVATLVLLLLWIGTMVYFLVFKEPKKETVYVEKPQQEQATTEQSTNENIQELNPKPNSELNENDYRNVAKKVTYNTNVDEVVETIFKLNPTDIKSSYDEQREVYSKQLIEANKDCFEDKNGVFYFVKDTLRHIPSYKK